MHRAAAKTRDLNDNVTPCVDDLPGLTTEREPLRRQLDDVRQVDLVRLPRLQLHQCHDASLIIVCALAAMPRERTEAVVGVAVLNRMLGAAGPNSARSTTAPI